MNIMIFPGVPLQVKSSIFNSIIGTQGHTGVLVQFNNVFPKINIMKKV